MPSGERAPQGRRTGGRIGPLPDMVAAPAGHPPPPPPPPASGRILAAPPMSTPWRPPMVPWCDFEEPPVTPIAPPPSMPSPYRSRSGHREGDEPPIIPTAPTVVQPSSRSRSEYRDRNDNDSVARSVRGIIQQTVVNSHTRSRSHDRGTERSTPPELRTPSTPASLAPTILYPPGSGASPAPTIYYPPGTPESIASTIRYPSPEPTVGQGSKRHQENSPEVQIPRPPTK